MLRTLRDIMESIAALFYWAFLDFVEEFRGKKTPFERAMEDSNESYIHSTTDFFGCYWALLLACWVCLWGVVLFCVVGILYNLLTK